jgi:anti-anti-sigma factor
VVRSEAEWSRVGLRLIGELDLNTVGLVAEEFAHTLEHSQPSVIDLSELRFLDPTGLRILQRSGPNEDESSTRLVGATGIVRRMIELARLLDAETPPPASHRLPASTGSGLSIKRWSSRQAARPVAAGPHAARSTLSTAPERVPVAR